VDAADEQRELSASRIKWVDQHELWRAVLSYRPSRVLAKRICADSCDCAPDSDECVDACGLNLRWQSSEALREWQSGRHQPRARRELQQRSDVRLRCPVVGQALYRPARRDFSL